MMSTKHLLLTIYQSTNKARGVDRTQGGVNRTTLLPPPWSVVLPTCVEDTVQDPDPIPREPPPDPISNFVKITVFNFHLDALPLGAGCSYLFHSGLHVTVSQEKYDHSIRIQRE